MLNISPRSVETHLRHARKRLHPDDTGYYRNIVIKQAFAWILIKVMRFSSEEVGKMLNIDPATARQHAKREQDLIENGGKKDI